MSKVSTTMYVRLPSIDVVKQFVEEVSGMSGDFDLVAGKYVIDAKSIMGIFSLDLSRPLLLDINQAEESDIDTLKKYAEDVK